MADRGPSLFDMLGENGPSGGGGFDTMLEILPEEMDGGFVDELTHSTNNSDGSNLERNSKLRTEEPLAAHTVGVEPLFPPNCPLPSMENHQNGEIAQLWDFNVDEFIMTPSQASDSATISAPNSFNSDFHPQMDVTGRKTSIDATGFGAAFDSHIASHSQGNNNWSHLLGNSFPSEINTQQLFTSPVGLRSEDSHGTPLFRPTLPTRRSSSQLTKNMGEDGSISLTSHSTTNSIRKNSVTRPLSSTSLSSYRQNSSSEVPRKAQVECFNCKTTKTPLWRRDGGGNTMCNACGLFQKLHGTMRPLSLKSDVIRKRNTKKRGKKPVSQDLKENTKSGKKNDTDQQDLALPSLSLNAQSSTESSANLSNFSSSETKSRISSFTNFSVNGTFSNPNGEQLSSKTLMSHDTRLMSSANAGISKKSSRSSSSSSASNSSNRSSSSRTMVPILPKPSPGATQRSQFQLMNNFTGSAGNSAASSPRIPSSPRLSSAQSPLPNSGGQLLSSSGGGPGIAIMRRKPSRPGSSSFMATSLQQHQQQHQLQLQQHQQPYQAQQQSQQSQQSQSIAFPSTTVGSSSSTISASSNSWNTAPNAVGPPKPMNSPRSPFDLFSSQEPQSRSTSRKSHTSLLSQQLQQASIPSQYPQSPSQLQTPSSVQSNGFSSSATPQPTSVERSPVTASPRNSYMDSIQQQRGLHPDASFRRTTPLRSESYNTPVINQNTYTSKQKDGTLDDLEWLKFGL
ncbi:LANO_0D01354g1_1 [Lachancea nothofagi CBS 11611]|uniref:LANO_0D01354g1_1 n=1 Tax=Lachancea nothofagi CBS 11611 TaxID=1266666 RepID=A0A1G4JDE5_9SACH|nr:LANO_0D01354g1_1 [Lachancea nothofagi CBS 11611]